MYLAKANGISASALQFSQKLFWKCVIKEFVSPLFVKERGPGVRFGLRFDPIPDPSPS